MDLQRGVSESTLESHNLIIRCPSSADTHTHTLAPRHNLVLLGALRATIPVHTRLLVAVLLALEGAHQLLLHGARHLFQGLGFEGLVSDV